MEESPSLEEVFEVTECIQDLVTYDPNINCCAAWWVSKHEVHLGTVVFLATPKSPYICTECFTLDHTIRNPRGGCLHIARVRMTRSMHVEPHPLNITINDAINIVTTVRKINAFGEEMSLAFMKKLGFMIREAHLPILVRDTVMPTLKERRLLELESNIYSILWEAAENCQLARALWRTKTHNGDGVDFHAEIIRKMYESYDEHMAKAIQDQKLHEDEEAKKIGGIELNQESQEL